MHFHHGVYKEHLISVLAVDPGHAELDACLKTQFSISHNLHLGKAQQLRNASIQTNNYGATHSFFPLQLYFTALPFFCFNFPTQCLEITQNVLFSKTRQIDHIWHFNELLSIENVNVARFARF